MSETTNKQFYDELTARLTRQIAAYQAPWQQPQQPGQDFMPFNSATLNRYKGINAIALASAAIDKGYEDNRWLTLKQGERLGGVLKPDEPGTTIQFWKFNDVVNGQKVNLEKPQVRLAVVYNAEQFANMPERQQAIRPLDDRAHDIRNMIKNGHANFVQDANGGGARYEAANDTIYVRRRSELDNPAQQMVDAVHQLAHWTGHPSRSNRDIDHPPGSSGHAREELRTNLASLFAGDQFQIGFDPGQHQSLAGPWRELLTNDPLEVFRASVAAYRIVADLATLSRDRDPVELGQEQMQELAKQVGSDRESINAVDKIELLAEIAKKNRESAVLVNADHPALGTQPQDRTYLAVPFAERDAAKAAGARWDRDAKSWYAPVDADLSKLAGWMPENAKVVAQPKDNPVLAFGDVIRDAGIELQGAPIADGKAHAVPLPGDRGEWRNGAWVGEASATYTLDLSAIPTGTLKIPESGVDMQWKAPRMEALSPEAKAELTAGAAQAKADEIERRDKGYALAAETGQGLWDKARPAHERQEAYRHPYLQDNGLTGEGMRIVNDPAQIGLTGALLIPMRDNNGLIQNLQIVRQSVRGEEARTQLWPGGKVSGAEYTAGNTADNAWPLILCERPETAEALHKLTGHTAVATFTAGNLAGVAEAYHAKNPDRTIYIAESGGYATDAAFTANAATLVPKFTIAQIDAGMSTWHDLAKADPDNAKKQLAAGMWVGKWKEKAATISQGQDRARADRPQARQLESLGHDRGLGR